MSKENLAAYLNDHLAGAVMAIDILKRLESPESGVAAGISGLREEIEADRDELRSLMDSLGIAPKTLRQFGGWVAEKVAQSKLLADGDAALREFQNLEILSLGIQGKLALWQVLQNASGTELPLRGPDYERLKQRARDQRARVESLRLQSAETALRIENTDA